MDMYCNISDRNPTCIPYANVGEKCTIDSPPSRENCLSPYRCNNVTGVCREVAYAAFGQQCTFTSDCSSELRCANGTCSTGLNPCRGKCDIDQYCENLEFLQIYGYNQSCNSDIKCAPFARCTSGVCQPVYYQVKGDYCDNRYPDSNDYFQNCEIGLTCNSSRVCEDYPTPTPSSYNCLAVNASCQSFETCFCTGQSNVGQCYPNMFTKEDGVPCLLAAQSYRQCIIKNKYIIYEYYPLSPSSCAIKNCGHQYCDMD